MKNYQMIGFDINDQFVQISYQTPEMSEPDTLYLRDDKNGTEMPLVVSYDPEKMSWVSPADSSSFERFSNDIIVRDLLSRSINNEEIEYNGEKYLVSDLLYVYIYETLTKYLRFNQNESVVDYLVFTISDITEEAITCLYNIAERLGIPRDKIFIQDYKESFYDYIWPQPSELSNYDVVLFGFKNHNLYGYKFSKSQISGTRRRDYVNISSDTIENITLDKSGDIEFEKFARSFFGRSLVSSVFLVGDEFDSNWYESTLAYVCNGRHVFQGKNMYSKGACYAALRKSGVKNTNLVYIDEFKTISRISIKVNNKGNEEWHPLLKHGENWYETNHEIEVLVDQVASIHIRIDTLGNNTPREEIIPLDGLFEKQRRTCKLNIKIVMYSRDLCKIVIDDEDFGEIMKSSGYHLEHMLTLEEA